MLDHIRPVAILPLGHANKHELGVDRERRFPLHSCPSDALAEWPKAPSSKCLDSIEGNAASGPTLQPQIDRKKPAWAAMAPRAAHLARQCTLRRLFAVRRLP
jgi:hypothetical protein